MASVSDTDPDGGARDKASAAASFSGNDAADGDLSAAGGAVGRRRTSLRTAAAVDFSSSSDTDEDSDPTDRRLNRLRDDAAI